MYIHYNRDDCSVFRWMWVSLFRNLRLEIFFNSQPAARPVLWRCLFESVFRSLPLFRISRPKMFIIFKFDFLADGELRFFFSDFSDGCNNNELTWRIALFLIFFSDISFLSRIRSAVILYRTFYFSIMCYLSVLEYQSRSFRVIRVSIFRSVTSLSTIGTSLEISGLR